MPWISTAQIRKYLSFVHKRLGMDRPSKGQNTGYMTECLAGYHVCRVEFYIRKSPTIRPIITIEGQNWLRIICLSPGCQKVSGTSWIFTEGLVGAVDNPDKRACCFPRLLRDKIWEIEYFKISKELKSPKIKDLQIFLIFDRKLSVVHKFTLYPRESKL